MAALLQPRNTVQPRFDPKSTFNDVSKTRILEREKLLVKIGKLNINLKLTSLQCCYFDLGDAFDGTTRFPVSYEKRIKV